MTRKVVRKRKVGATFPLEGREGMLQKVTQRPWGELAMLYVLTWVVLTRISALHLFIIWYIYVLYTFISVLYFRFFKNNQGKEAGDNLGVLLPRECVDKCGHCM